MLSRFAQTLHDYADSQGCPCFLAGDPTELEAISTDIPLTPQAIPKRFTIQRYPGFQVLIPLYDQVLFTPEVTAEQLAHLFRQLNRFLEQTGAPSQLNVGQLNISQLANQIHAALSPAQRERLRIPDLPQDAPDRERIVGAAIERNRLTVASLGNDAQKLLRQFAMGMYLEDLLGVPKQQRRMEQIQLQRGALCSARHQSIACLGYAPAGPRDLREHFPIGGSDSLYADPEGGISLVRLGKQVSPDSTLPTPDAIAAFQAQAETAKPIGQLLVEAKVSRLTVHRDVVGLRVSVLGATPTTPEVLLDGITRTFGLALSQDVLGARLLTLPRCTPPPQTITDFPRLLQTLLPVTCLPLRSAQRRITPAINQARMHTLRRLRLSTGIAQNEGFAPRMLTACSQRERNGLAFHVASLTLKILLQIMDRPVPAYFENFEQLHLIGSDSVAVDGVRRFTLRFCKKNEQGQWRMGLGFSGVSLQ